MRAAGWRRATRRRGGRDAALCARHAAPRRAAPLARRRVDAPHPPQTPSPPSSIPHTTLGRPPLLPARPVGWDHGCTCGARSRGLGEGAAGWRAQALHRPAGGKNHATRVGRGKGSRGAGEGGRARAARPGCGRAGPRGRRGAWSRAVVGEGACTEAARAWESAPRGSRQRRRVRAGQRRRRFGSRRAGRARAPRAARARAARAVRRGVDPRIKQRSPPPAPTAAASPRPASRACIRAPRARAGGCPAAPVLPHRGPRRGARWPRRRRHHSTEENRAPAAWPRMRPRCGARARLVGDGG